MKSERHNGFTLLELLVVVAIIATLALLATYATRSARLRANEAASITNLRNLAAANLLYTTDHGTYVPANEPRNRIRWHGGRDSASGSFDPAKGYLADYLGPDRRVTTCPEFKRHLTDASWENGSGGYGYNALYIGGLPQNPFKPNRPAGVPNPARTLMFATTAFAVSGGIQEYPFADPPQWVDANWQPGGSLQPSVHFRFRNRALVAWCDGRVTAESPTKSPASENYYGGSNSDARIGFCGPTENNGWWNPRN
jgi:prepilin-type N-terminal cleavage/methylation domain-containing protein